MKVLIAIDSFKGSLSSVESSDVIFSAIKSVYPDAEIISFPLADGGEGTVESIVHAVGGNIVSLNITGPLTEKIEGNYGILQDGKTAIIEIAEACGLPLLSNDQLNPLKATSYGVGEIILDAIKKGCKEFIIGLGGSATNDAGIGMLQALGFQFLDNNNQEVDFGGSALHDIKKINLNKVNKALQDCTFKIACDVNNQLTGKNGATYVFGPQKGATPEIVDYLDKGMIQFTKLVEEQLGFNIDNISGGGAAGGLGSAFSGFLNGTLQSGIDLILQTINLEKHIQGSDYVITGEGKLDKQTTMGKVPVGVARLAAEKKIPVIALAGYITDEIEVLNDHHITSCISIMNKPMSVNEAMKPDNTKKNLAITTNQLFRLIKKIT